MTRGLDNLHSHYLYRVLRGDESPDNDLVCCDPTSPRTIDQHVETGLTEPSKFISTTTDFDNALRWLNKANEKSRTHSFMDRSVIVQIDLTVLKSKYSAVASAAYDLSNLVNREEFLKTDKQKSFSESYDEVVFINRIPSDVVSIYYINGIGLITKEGSVNSLEESDSQISSASGFSIVSVDK